MDSMSSQLLAYIDPAVGSIVIQGVIAAVATFGYLLRKKIGSAFRWAFQGDRKEAFSSDTRAENVNRTDS